MKTFVYRPWIYSAGESLASVAMVTIPGSENFPRRSGVTSFTCPGNRNGRPPYRLSSSSLSPADGRKHSRHGKGLTRPAYDYTHKLFITQGANMIGCYASPFPRFAGQALHVPSHARAYCSENGWPLLPRGWVSPPLIQFRLQEPIPMIAPRRANSNEGEKR